MNNIIVQFIESVKKNEIEIYNEFSLQHEFGIFLRRNFQNLKVQFERNVSHFSFSRNSFIKKEIDISIFDNDVKELIMAIELKYPRNGQYPEQMYSFCKDIMFTEQLKKAGFKSTYTIIFAEDPLFYSGGVAGIYGCFRGSKIINGKICKPTGQKNSELFIEGSYEVEWKTISKNLKYTIIETNNCG